MHARRPSPTAGLGAIAGFADEAVAALDAAGADRALVYDVSFGGLVAQQIALRHPHRVGGLVLAATSAGGDRRVAPDDDARDSSNAARTCRPKRDCGQPCRTPMPWPCADGGRTDRRGHRRPARAAR